MSEWIEENSNRISRTAQLLGQNKIQVKGNSTIGSGAVLNGDVKLIDESPFSINIGNYCYIASNVIITPPIVDDTCAKHCSSSIGSYTIIGSNSQLRLVSIGNRVIIEDNCLIDQLTVIYDCCIIRKGCVVPPKSVIPPFSEVSGIPGKDFNIRSLNGGYKRANEMKAKQLQILGM